MPEIIHFFLVALRGVGDGGNTVHSVNGGEQLAIIITFLEIKFKVKVIGSKVS